MFKLVDETYCKYRAFHGTRPLTQFEAFTLLASDSHFREALRRVFIEEGPAYFWECKPTTIRSAPLTAFEFVLVPAPALMEIQSDPHAFNDKFQPGKMTVSFPSLARNTLLVAPTSPSGDYAHLGRFVRNAPVEEFHDLFQHVGKLVLERLSDEPLWVSTSGLRVYWLHVRLDPKPKYYSYADYKQEPVL